MRGAVAFVYDSFEAHVTNTVNASFKRENTDLAVIPGGLPSLLQPLDVSLNKSFEDGVWKQWMTDGIHEFTASGRQKKASEELICLWISQAWKAIPSEKITASFLKCGITINTDGSQDELVYNSSEVTDELDSVIKNLFESDCDSEFEGFVVYRHWTFYLSRTQCSDDIQATSSAVSRNNVYELLLW